MAEDKVWPERGRGRNKPAEERPRRGWERPVVKPRSYSGARPTFRVDAPSPSEEILARYEADLAEESDAPDPSQQIICF